MQMLIEQLTQVLRQTEESYQQLLPVIEKEKDLVRRAAVDALGAVASEKEHLLVIIRQLDNKRGHLLNQIQDMLNLSGRKPTLKELVGLADPEQGRRLQQIRVSLKSLLIRIRAMNNENRALIHHCLGLVRQALSTVSPKAATSSVYQATGALAAGEGGGHLVSNSV